MLIIQIFLETEKGASSTDLLISILEQKCAHVGVGTPCGRWVLRKIAFVQNSASIGVNH